MALEEKTISLDQPEAQNTPLPTERPFQDRFDQFGAALKLVDDEIIYSEKSIEDLTDEDLQQKMDAISPQPHRIVREAILDAIKKYRQGEINLTEWWKTHMDQSSAESQKQLYALFNNGQEFTPAEASAPEIRRMKGGLALVVSPEDFQRLVISGLEASDGTITKDSNEIEDFINTHSELGFILENMPENAAHLPAGIKLAIISRNQFSPTGVERAIHHEEQEGIGLYIDESPTLEFMDSRSPKLLQAEMDRVRMREALYDMAARIEEGGDPDTLDDIGVSKNWTDAHPTEAKLLLLTQQHLHTDKENLPSDPKALARLIRGGAVRPENLLAYLSGSTDITALLEEATTFNMFDSNGKIPVSEREGRFIYHEPTLVAGETLKCNGVNYVIDSVKARGGQGVVYLASLGGKHYIIKEAIFPLGPEGLLEGGTKTRTYIENVIQNKSFENDPSALIKEITEYGATAVTDANGVTKLNLTDLGRFIKIRVAGNLRAKFRGRLGYQGKELVTLAPDNSPIINIDPPTLFPWDKHEVDPAVVAEIMTTIKDTVANAVDAQEVNPLRAEIVSLRESFDNEIKILGLLTKAGVKGIPSFKGKVDSDGSYNNIGSPKYHCTYYIQDLVEGVKPSYLNLQYNESIEITIKLLEIMEQVHANFVVHKDIKPGNILVDIDPVTKEHKVRLVDFGSAKVTTGPQGATVNIGTHGFAPKEQYTTQGADYTSDLHAIAVTLFTFFNHGHPLWEQNIEPEDYIKDHGFEGYRTYLQQRLKQLNINQEMIDIILKATEVDSKDRFQTATEMKLALEKALNPALTNQPLPQNTPNQINNPGTFPTPNQPLPPLVGGQVTTQIGPNPGFNPPIQQPVNPIPHVPSWTSSSGNTPLPQPTVNVGPNPNILPNLAPLPQPNPNVGPQPTINMGPNPNILPNLAPLPQPNPNVGPQLTVNMGPNPNILPNLAPLPQPNPNVGPQLTVNMAPNPNISPNLAPPPPTTRLGPGNILPITADMAVAPIKAELTNIVGRAGALSATEVTDLTLAVQEALQTAWVDPESQRRVPAMITETLQQLINQGKNSDEILDATEAALNAYHASATNPKEFDTTLLNYCASLRNRCTAEPAFMAEAAKRLEKIAPICPPQRIVKMLDQLLQHSLSTNGPLPTELFQTANLNLGRMYFGNLTGNELPAEISAYFTRLDEIKRRNPTVANAALNHLLTQTASTSWATAEIRTRVIQRANHILSKP